MSVSNTKNKILLITILLGLIIIGCFIATEITAFKFHFQEALGKPTRLGSIRLYPPFYYFKWYTDFSEFVTNKRVWLPGFLCLIVTAIFSSALIAYFKCVKMKSPMVDTYGSAHWASEKEIKDSGLLYQTNPLSCYVGAWQKNKNTRLHYLRFAGPEHIFAYAPTRSGKGVGLVIPTLLSYQGSMIISDFKGENWHITAGWRKSINHTVLKFDPTSIDGKSARFNPLLEVRPGIHEVRDVQNIVDMISDPLGLGKNDHWTNAANDVLVCLILHVLYAEKNKSLTGVREFISNPYSSETEIFESMSTTRHDPENKYHWVDPHTGGVTETHPVVAAGSKDMLNKSSEERSGIMSTLKTLMKLYRDPIIAQNTSYSDFRIHDLVYGENPCSLYLVIPPGDINRTMPLMRLVLNQILTRLTESLEINSETQRHPLKLLLDEFPQFGKLEFLEKGLAYLAGYNISAYLIAQDLTQVYSAFGHYQSIIANCGVRIAYAPNTIETAKHLSTLLGSKTLVKEQFNYSGERFSFLLKNINVNQHETRRELLTPDELMRLPDDVAIIFKTGHSPIYGRKIRYYSDPIFCTRAQVVINASDCLAVKSEWSHIKVEENPVNVKTNNNTVMQNEIQISFNDDVSESLI